MEQWTCDELGLFNLPAGERVRVRGSRPIEMFPLTPALSPAELTEFGEGSSIHTTRNSQDRYLSARCTPAHARCASLRGTSAKSGANTHCFPHCAAAHEGCASAPCGLQETNDQLRKHQ